MSSSSYEVQESQRQFWIDVGDVNEIGGLRNVRAQYPFPTEDAYKTWFRENGWIFDEGAKRYKNAELPHLAASPRRVSEFRREKWL